MNKAPTLITQADRALMRQSIQTIRGLLDGTPRYMIVTLGCQMNVRDSETYAGMLEQMGYQKTINREEADLILYNTCCVRENAENKALGNVIWLKELKKTKPGLIVCVAGCMMQENGVAQRLIEAYPFIDLILGTHNLHRFAYLLCRVLTERKPLFEVQEDTQILPEDLPVRRLNRYMAFVNIMYGCNNFCTYCIVPYVRGRERSRAERDVLEEVRRLKDEGVQEIMLLGQNVNSYGGGGAAFANLLEKIETIEIPRVRFMTSHPKDLSPELIEDLASLPHLAKHLHLPVQAGSDQILQRMNRRYTRVQYLDLIEKLRRRVPIIGLTSDIIVGFPGETEDDFTKTLSLVRAVRFDAAYTFIFSPRGGTPASRMEDNVSAAEKTERIERLIALQQSITAEVLNSRIGSRESVLVESVSARDPGWISGKTSRGHMVSFEGPATMIGTFQTVVIESSGKNTLRGRLV